MQTVNKLFDEPSRPTPTGSATSADLIYVKADAARQHQSGTRNRDIAMMWGIGSCQCKEPSPSEIGL
jgi:hypothetical protein